MHVKVRCKRCKMNKDYLMRCFITAVSIVFNSSQEASFFKAKMDPE